MFKIDDRTTWWSPSPELVIDARDLVKIEVLPSPTLDGGTAYRMFVLLTDSQTLDLMYPNLEKLNSTLTQVGLTWEDPDA